MKLGAKLVLEYPRGGTQNRLTGRSRQMMKTNWRHDAAQEQGESIPSLQPTAFGGGYIPTFGILNRRER